MACALFAVSVQAAPVVLVQGTRSTPNTSERNYAGSVTRRIDGWLSELGISHRVVPDEKLSRKTLSGVKVAVLTYNPNLPASELAVLEAFTKRGGRLVVFYSADPNLAQLMGLKLGSYRADPKALRWTRMAFADNALPGGPRTVYQRSRNIRPVTPRWKRGKVVAYWEDAAGKRREPAWVQTGVGFWMTHVLLDDGDTWHKQQLLVALLGALDPGVWPDAARAARRRAETLGIFKSYSETERVIRSRAPRTGSAAKAAAALAAARKTRAQLDELVRAKQYAAAVAQSDVLLRQLTQAYAATFRVSGQRMRGVWDHFGLGLYPGDWRRTCRELDLHGITDVFVNVLWPGRALYPSKVLPVDDVVAVYGDPLKAAVTEGHAQGLKMHLWKVCWKLDGAPESLMTSLRKAGRLQRSDNGAELPWLCPSHPDNLRHEKDSLREALRLYPVDGIHLDYIRYPGSYGCYCSGCRKRFEVHLGRRVGRWPEDARKGRDRQAYTKWRCAQITRLVRDVSALARKARPGIQLSAAVYGKYPSCRDSVAQDWPGWVNEGLIDFVAPMNYTDHLDGFDKLLKSQVALLKDDSRLCPGIGVTAAESRLGVPATLQQIEEAQQRGAGGFILFDLNEVLSREILPFLGLD
ncbi:MAG: family 10 glycosylhydrolase [Kiritimatiellae bacterium]|nr:family 10 glycosylhydrolase [Kiritimatiellia bacterium]